jgi:thiamine-phosphate pyrophosphorylase
VSEYTRLVLIAPLAETAAEILPPLQAALAAERIDVVILPLPARDERGLINLVKEIVPAVHAGEAVLMLAGHADLVVRSGADGVHLASPANVGEVVSALHPQERNVGTGGITSRHIAMETAEAGVDYIMFGEPKPDGYIPPLEDTIERAAWWAELFNTPCIVYAPDFAALEPLAATGAEFIALGDAVFNHPEGPAEAVRQAMAIIKAVKAP